MTPEAEDLRHKDRRLLDVLLRAIPFVSLVAALGFQTVYFTRYLSSIEARLDRQIEKNSEMSVQLAALNSTVTAGAVPSAINQRRVEDLERLVGRIEGRVTENERRMSVDAARTRALRDR